MPNVCEKFAPKSKGLKMLKTPKAASEKTAAGSATRLTEDDALYYLREVKERFWDNREVYESFLDLMKDFKSKR